jgi:hypothetical protein
MGETNLTGHCYCGAVKFEITGKSDWVGHCHCESCRRQSGSVMTTFAGFKLEQVSFTGATPKSTSSEDGATRRFCGDCGSPVSYEYRNRPGEIHLQLGLFDDLESLVPQDHSFLEEKPGWFHADENLPVHNWTPQNPD